MSNVVQSKDRPKSILSSTKGRVQLGLAVVLVVIVAAACWMTSASAETPETPRLAKATITDCTSTLESTSQINTSEALLEGLSFAEKNPFFMNARTTLTSPFRFALPTDAWIEKAEWTYDDNGRVKSTQFFKSTNPLSSATFSYDSHNMVSKVVGWTYENVDGSAQRNDFEASFVNEALSSKDYGANKTTVVHGSGTENDTVLYTYDKDKNLTDISSKGSHPWKLTYSYVTAFKVTKDLKVSVDGADEGEYYLPTYDASNKLVSLQTGTWNGSETELSGDEYVVQYSGSKYSKVDYYVNGEQVRYYQFGYTGSDLTSIRVYKKGGEQLYAISLSWK